jgi:hypothetical protein
MGPTPAVTTTRLPTMRATLALFLGLLTIGGCGAAKVGKLYTCEAGFVYFDKADLISGGPPDREFLLQLANRGDRLSFRTLVEVTDVDGKYAKIKLMDGDKKGLTGWVAAEGLADAAELLRMRAEWEAGRPARDAAKRRGDDEEEKARPEREAAEARAKVAALLTQAKEHVAGGEPGLAARYYKDIAEKYPKSPEAKRADELYRELWEKAYGSKP